MILPKPQSCERGDGRFRLTPDTTVFADAGSEPAARALRSGISPATGFPFPSASTADRADIRLTVDADALGPEAYTLNVDADGIRIVGGDPAGVFYGVQSLRQLLPPEVYGTKPIDRIWEVEHVSVRDAPRFSWRGMMLDVGRHFMSKEFVCKFIDLLAMHKLNVFHFSLTQDQGWRLQIDKYPKLTEVGAWRSETIVGHMRDYASPEDYQYDGKPHGGYYTKDDIREILAYAEARFVTVIPEINMPGHMLAAIAAYPELGNGTGPYQVGKIWGIMDQVLNVQDSTLAFCQDVLTEVLELFPSHIIHAGGDECPKTEWKASAAAQARMRELGLETEEQLQLWFTTRIANFLKEKGRRFVGWDEILEGGGPAELPDDVVVMSWRSEDGGIEAARGGLDVVMSPTSYAYFDYYQGDPATEPLAIGGSVPLEKVYDYHVVPEELDEKAAEHVIGTQANVWTEYIPNSEHVEYMIAPRMCAFAEAAWRERKVDPYETFVQERLRPQLARFDAIGVNYRPL